MLPLGPRVSGAGGAVLSCSSCIRAAQRRASGPPPRSLGGDVFNIGNLLKQVKKDGKVAQVGQVGSMEA